MTPGDRRQAPEDGGFTLVEVIVALSLMGVLMSSVAVLFVGGVRNGAGLQRRQAAVAVAAQAVEAVRAVSVQPDGAGCVKLLQGRTQAMVDAQWAAAPASIDLSSTSKAVNPTTCAGPVVVPLVGVPRAAGTVVDPVLLNGLPYTIRTYIGSCRQPVSPLGAGCTSSGSAADQLLYRVVVTASWTGPGCSATCTYATSTLLDPAPDPVYNVRAAGGPTVADDSLCFVAGNPAALNVLANDGGALGRKPVSVVQAPAHGSLSPTITKGVATFRPDAGYTGTDRFTYRLTDVNGLVSPLATVNITITNGVCP